MENLPLWALAMFWGSFAGTALLIGAFLGFYLKLNQRVVAGVMAFGSGALISALSFELTEKAYLQGGLAATMFGFAAGALVYSGANYLLSHYGARHRKRSDIRGKLGQEKMLENSKAIALGALIDGIPESLVIGLGFIEGGAVSLVTVAAVFISNLPEGLSSSAGMRSSGRSFRYVISIWGGIALLSSVTAALGYQLFRGLPAEGVSVIMAVAAGAILAMIVDTMIPEAFEETHNFSGLITAAGFLCAFMVDKL